ncbi:MULTISPECIES: HetZ-related protein [unclassified Coleofasciculus]|uniref:HetZ-related protein n=1 Tax=unclassified Coleofasciculus TaxID=2692782 RepID=UPI00188060DC|nr:MULTISPECIES: HetZ-related protein [unclassified Coleofasciculus]MBE9129386.1 HetZ-related protein [Coleofasciculus sp. LEGE 07081]MBE9152020.1 HetZ-related protein [Coleofasciculus sp. LEGE 07092]
MNVKTANSINQNSQSHLPNPDIFLGNETQALSELVLEEMCSALSSANRLGKPSSAAVSVESLPSRARAVAKRIEQEVERICSKSDRIQTSGQVRSWQLTLARHRLNKCLSYYKLGSKQGRVELHSNLSVMVYRHVAQPQSQLKFSGRYNLIEDFLQDFYAESLKAFRRENPVEPDYTPRTQIELAEYMAFTEQYAKRRITLPNRSSQQLIVLRAQSFARRQPSETVVDIEQAVEFAKGEDAQEQSRLPAIQQVRAHLVAQTTDPSESVLRDRVVSELVQYLEEHGHTDCADYLVLKLQDLAAPEIDEILGLTPRQRDYLQQRFKYHVEKFSRSSHWKLVHQWLGADLDQKLGMSSEQWEAFFAELDEQQQQLLSLKQDRQSDFEIARTIGCTPKQLQKRWTQLLELAWKIRNSGGAVAE